MTKPKLTDEERAYFAEHTPSKASRDASVKATAPKCPTCTSANVRRITGGRKLGRLAMIGPFAIPKALKSYECLNCKARW